MLLSFVAVVVAIVTGALRRVRPAFLQPAFSSSRFLKRARFPQAGISLRREIS